MTQIELADSLEVVQSPKAETQTLEVKAAAQGCPKRLYDSISAFSNQDDGGCILFDQLYQYGKAGDIVVGELGEAAYEEDVPSLDGLVDL